MAFPADYTLLGDFAFPSVTGTHTDFVAYIKYDDFTTEMLTSIDDGGGDLRFSSDAAGVTQLPCEVVKFDKVGSSVVVFVKIPSASTSQKFYIWGDNTGDSQPIVTDPFGRNAVWSDYLAVYHLNDLVDSTGNNSDLTGTASSSTTTKLGAGSYFFDGTEFLEETGIGYSSGDLVVQTWSRHTNLSADNNTLVSVGDDLQEYAWVLYRDDPDADAFGLYSRGSGDSDSFNSASSISTNTWYKNTTVFDISNTIEIYQNGSSLGSAALGGSASMSTPELNIGARLGSSNFMIGQIEGVRITLTVPNADRELTEYQNQDAVGAYFIATDAGGGVTVTGQTPMFFYSAIAGLIETGGEENITGQTPLSFHSPAPALIDLTPEIVIDGKSPQYTFNPVNGFVDVSGEITVNGETPHYGYAPTQGLIDLTGEIITQGETPQYGFSGISASIDLTPEINVIGGVPSFNYQPMEGLIDTTGSIDIEGKTPNYTYQAVDGIITLQGEIDVIGQAPDYSFSTVNSQVVLVSGKVIDLSSLSISYLDDGVKLQYIDNGINITYN